MRAEVAWKDRSATTEAQVAPGKKTGELIRLEVLPQADFFRAIYEPGATA